MLAPLNQEADSTALPITSSPNRRCQIRYRQPLWSGYRRPSGTPFPWVGPSAVWGDKDTAVWGSWWLRSHCPSNPSAVRTWAPTGPGSRTSTTGRLGSAELSGKYPNLQHLRGEAERLAWALQSHRVVLLCSLAISFCFSQFGWCRDRPAPLLVNEPIAISSKIDLKSWICKRFWSSSILSLLGLHISLPLFTQVDIYICFITCQDQYSWN